jgi:tetratricopeptide (TPR) repeat protein
MEKHFENNNPRYLESLCFVIASLFEKGTLKETKTYVEQLKKEFPELLVSWLFSAAQSFNENNQEEGLRTLEVAFGMVDSKTPPHEIYELAAFFVEAGKYEKSIELFGKIASRKNSNALSRGLIYAQ